MFRTQCAPFCIDVIRCLFVGKFVKVCIILQLCQQINSELRRYKKVRTVYGTRCSIVVIVPTRSKKATGIISFYDITLLIASGEFKEPQLSTPFENSFLNL